MLVSLLSFSEPLCLSVCLSLSLPPPTIDAFHHISTSQYTRNCKLPSSNRTVMLIVFDLYWTEMGDELEKSEKDMRYDMQCKKDEYFCYHTASFFEKKGNK